MLSFSAPEVGEDALFALYQQATSGDDPDKVEIELIEPEMRKAAIKLKRRPGVSSVGDGVATMADLRAAASA